MQFRNMTGCIVEVAVQADEKEGRNFSGDCCPNLREKWMIERGGWRQRSENDCGLLTSWMCEQSVTPRPPFHCTDISSAHSDPSLPPQSCLLLLLNMLIFCLLSPKQAC